MPNLFVDLPLPALNGPGASVDTSGMGVPKTIEVVGDFPGSTIAVEASTDGGVTFAPAATFQNVGGKRVVPVVAQFMRVNVQGRKASVPFSANCDVGANSNGAQFAAIAIPAGNGPGAPTNVGTFGDSVTFIVGGVFPGATVTIQISEDGVTYAPFFVFGGQGGLISGVVTANFVRANVAGRKPSVPFTADASIGAATNATSASGINVDDDGVSIGVGPFTELDFIGPGVTAVDAGGGVAAITIPGGIQGIDIDDESVPIGVGPFTELNFLGAGVTATDAGGGVGNITIPGSISGIAIGDPVVGGTTGAALFVGAGPVLSQDAANYFWDNTNKRLGIGNNAPTTPLDVTGTARMTNAAITAMTIGSLLFAGAGGAVTQDNANIFWDNTAKRLGIGTNAPDSPLHVVGAVHITGKLTVDGAIDPTSLTLVAAGNLAYLEQADGQSAAVSPANRGRLRYNQPTQKWQVSANGVAYADVATGTAGMAIGGTVTAGTTGSALFIGAGPVLAQDNANYFWDNTNKRLGIGTVAPAVPLHIVRPMPADGLISLTNTGTGGAATDGYSDVLFNDNAGVLQGAIGYGNATVATTHLRSLNFLYSAVSKDWILANPTVVQWQFGMTAASAFIEFANGSSAAVSSSTHGRLRYNTSTDRFQVSRNTAPYAELASIVSGGAGTSGPVWFTSNGLNQLFSNSTFFWDNTNTRLGINTASPALSLDVRSSSNGVGCVNVACTSTSGDSSVTFCAAATPSTAAGSFGFGNSFSTPTHIRSKLFLSSASADFVMANATRNEFTFGLTSGSPFMEMANGSGAASSAANTGRLRYNSTGQKLQASFNTAGYFDVGTYAAALTTGSVMFANGSNQLAQDNANFFWDSTNHLLGIGTASPGVSLDINASKGAANLARLCNTDATGYSAMSLNTAAGTIRGTLGYGNATVADTFLQTRLFMRVADTSPTRTFDFTNDATVSVSIGTVDTAAYLGLADGSSLGVGPAGMAAITYDPGTDKIYVSKNGAARVEIVTL